MRSSSPRWIKELSSLNPYNPIIHVGYTPDTIILVGQYYTIKLNIPITYPFAPIGLEIKVPKRIEMICRFGKYLLNKLSLPEDCIDNIINFTAMGLLNSDSLEYKKMHCKKYLLDYGKSTEAMWEYDDNMSISVLDYFGNYIKKYLDICKKYSYAYPYINKWDTDLVLRKEW